MIGVLLAAIGIKYVYDKTNEAKEYKNKCNILELYNYHLKCENNYYKVTIANHKSLLKNYDVINQYAKGIGYKGAVDFFYYLANKHDSRFEHLARFLDKVRHIRNDVAHNGKFHTIDQGFLNKLSACVDVCKEHSRLSYGKRLRLN